MDNILQYVAAGGTNYSYGMKLAEEIIDQGSSHPDVVKNPMVIFLSDGGNNDGGDPL